MSELRKELESLLLSEEFLNKFAAAFLSTAMPPGIESLEYDPQSTTAFALPATCSPMTASMANQIENGTSEPR